MECWSCGYGIEDKISFRSECNRCGAFLHCCKNCKFFQEGLYNDCKVPGTERVLDKESRNFCEDFALLGKCIEKKETPSKKKFEDLFK